jgi:hypothetical protein
MLDYSLGGIAIRESGTPGGRDEATGGSVTGGTRDLDERAGGVLRPVLEPLSGSRGPVKGKVCGSCTSRAKSAHLA